MSREFRPGKIQILRDRFNLLFARGQLKMDLPVILAGVRSEASLEDRIGSLESLMAWVRLPLNSGPGPTEDARGVRFRFVLQLLGRNPEWRVQLGAVLSSVMRDASGVRLFCHAGLSQETGFFSEASNRLMRKFLPRTEREPDLAELFSRVFTEAEDADWIEGSPESVVVPIVEMLEGASGFPALRSAMRDALVILGAQVAALGVSDEIRSRLPAADFSESPFVDLNRALSQQGAVRDLLRIRASIERCREALGAVFRKIEDSGVSVGLVYKLENLGAMLGRIELLANLLEAREPGEVEAVLPRFLGSLVREEVSSRSIRGLVQANVHLLARKVVERTGHKGEHYIARSRTETLEMLRSAGGGGVLTVVTALLKLAIGHAHCALFFEGLFSWINYAGSFVAMQALGFSLATKQPSMTASSLAATLEPLSGTRSSEAVTGEISAIVRSQAAAAIGNVGAVVPTAILLDYAWRALFGASIMDPEYARHFVASLDPLGSWTLPFAALTGVFLWLASICAGWAENWVVFRRVPQAIGRSRRLVRVFGEARVERWSKSFAPTTSGLAGNVSLGFFLAFTPIFGRFFGVALDVRHVTLSSGALALAFCSLGYEHMTWGMITAAIIGILLIGLLNFGVSFVLALEVAARSRNIPRRWMVRVLRGVILRFFRAPVRFLMMS